MTAEDAEMPADDAELPAEAVQTDNKRNGPKKRPHADWMSKWADSLSLVPSELHPPETEHGSNSWTVHNEASGARVEVLFTKGLVVKSCPVVSFLAESRRKDGGRHVAWSLKGTLEDTWSWLATEIGWISERAEMHVMHGSVSPVGDEPRGNA